MGEPPTRPSRDNEECPGCGYSLLALVGSTCPECGIDVDQGLAVRRTAIRPGRYVIGISFVVGAWAVLALLANAIALAVMHEYGAATSVVPEAGAAAMMGINAIVMALMISRRDAIRGLSSEGGRDAFRCLFWVWTLSQPIVLFLIVASS